MVNCVSQPSRTPFSLSMSSARHFSEQILGTAHLQCSVSGIYVHFGVHEWFSVTFTSILVTAANAEIGANADLVIYHLSHALKRPFTDRFTREL